MTPLDIGRIRRAFPGRRVEYFERVDSTMNAAAACEPGSVALAEEQTAGLGRHGHKWHSEPGAGIYCSIVLRPAPALTLALGLATAEAIREATGVECDLRWPNDLICGGRKVAGILVQVVGDKAIAGIGINVSQTAFPGELETEATSLSLVVGQGFRPAAGLPPGAPAGRPAAARKGRPALSREEIILALLPAVDAHAQLDKNAILRLFAQASSYASGRRVVVHQPGGIIEGITAGLDPSGFLIVRRDDGTDTLILTGGVRAAGS